MYAGILFGMVNKTLALHKEKPFPKRVHLKMAKCLKLKGERGESVDKV